MNTLKAFGFMFSVMVVMQFNHSIVEALKGGGFSVDLIHRDSPLSPFYNHSDTDSNRFRNAALRSKSRVNHFRLSSFQSNKVQSDVSLGSNLDYLMKFAIGTPPVNVIAIADTGSDLIWTQCNSPSFNPQQSSTYKELPCGSEYCQALKSRARCGNNNDCEYKYSYGNGLTYTIGVLSGETFTFDSTTGQSVSLPNVAFGCASELVGNFDRQASGLAGLGGGPLSLVSQLPPEMGTKFSYCLVPRSSQSASKLNFGNEATISSQGVVSTPLISKYPVTYYYVTLEGISLGDQRLDMNPPATPGNIVVDSGTTLTFLEANFYTRLESAVQQSINLEPVPDPTGQYQFCYNTNGDLMMPEMMFHFTGADLKLNQMNVFVKHSDDLLCFAMAPSQELSILGNVAQINFQVLYDLQGKKISFAPADCTNV